MGYLHKTDRRINEMAGDECRMIRLRLGLTQRQMAGHLGMTHHAVEHYEAGRRRPNGAVTRLYRQLDAAPHAAPQ